MILDQIVADKKIYVEEAKTKRSVEALISASRDNKRSLIGSIKARKPAIIAEIKKRSPSGGEMNSGYGLAELASIYEANGAAGISVLTDEKYFGGKPEDMLKVREVVSLPILRKDFIIDEYQIYEAKAFGADAILLITAILDDGTIDRFITLAHELGLEVLLESHTEDEIRRSVTTGTKLLGINNRNLHTLQTDLRTSVDLLRFIPDDRIAISESGISSSSDIRRLFDAGADGFLIGEALLKSGNPGRQLAEFISGVQDIEVSSRD